MNNNWIDEAACVGEDSNTFFADSGDKGENLRKEARAKNICRKCNVAAECLLHALNNDEIFGIWGSFAPKERRTIKSLFSNIDINVCRAIVNKEIRSIKAKAFFKEIN